MDRRPGWDVLERKAVAHTRLGLGTRHDGVADLQLVRREDVALLAVLVMKEREARGAVRVVLDRGHARRDPVLEALEVDQAVVPLLAAAAVTCRDPTLRVAAGVAELPLHERALGLLALRDLGERGGLPETKDGRICLV